jgi:hypothetical protein
MRDQVQDILLPEGLSLELRLRWAWWLKRGDQVAGGIGCSSLTAYLASRRYQSLRSWRSLGYCFAFFLDVYWYRALAQELSLYRENRGKCVTETSPPERGT